MVQQIQTNVLNIPSRFSNVTRWRLQNRARQQAVRRHFYHKLIDRDIHLQEVTALCAGLALYA
jgi:hypothetical protein